MTLRIAVCPADKTGCGTYRISYPAQAVQEIRPDWQIELYYPGVVRVATRNGRATSVQGLDPHGLDLLVLQRIGQPGPLAFQRWAQEHGIAVVVDSDDAMWCIHKDNVAYRQWNSAALHWKYLDAAMDSADLVTVTTDYLGKRYGWHGRLEVLPNRVPDAVLNLKGERANYDPDPTIGWAGLTATHPNDLPTVGKGIRKALDATGARVRVVGSEKGVDEALGLPDGTTECVGSKPLGIEYYSALTCMDVAIVPLEDSNFNRGKSSLKALEFSAMGVPVVATPTPANRLLAKDLPIILASTPDEWAHHVTRLLNDPTERAERSALAREVVREKWTVEGNAELWANAWERAIRRRARMVA